MNKYNYIDLKKTSRIKTFGNSMYPLLHNGDIVFYKPVLYKDIMVNDLLVVKKDYMAFTHRVIYKTSTYLITKGDNNLEADPKVKEQDIIGRLTHIKRKGQEINPETIYSIQSAYYFKEIVKINNLLKKKKISFLFLKGLPLYLYLYKTNPRRIYSDCDLLIQTDDFHKTIEIFKQNKYKIFDTDLLHNKLMKDRLAVNMYKKINGFPVKFDLHFKLNFLMTQFDSMDYFYSHKYIVNLNREFFDSKRTITLNGSSFDILSKENLILYLLLHYYHHNFRGIYRLDFIYKIITAEKNINWKKIYHTIISYKLENFVYPGFELLGQYFYYKIPHSRLLKISKGFIQMYIYRTILNGSIMNGELRFKAGIKRFLFMFFLSPEPLNKKIMGILNRKVLSVGVIVIKTIIQNTFRYTFLKR